MDIDEILKKAHSALAAERVFGAPVERDGVTVIPAAKVMGGEVGGAEMPTRADRTAAASA